MGMAGKLAKLYREQTWTDGSDLPDPGSWEETCCIVDLTFDQTVAEVDISCRCVDQALYTQGLSEQTLTFQYRLSQGVDDEYDAYLQAFLNNTPMLLGILDDDIATVGAKGWKFVGAVMQVTENYPLTDGVAVDITVRPTSAKDASGDQIPTTRWVIAGP